MDGKVTLEAYVSTEPNNSCWGAKGEQRRNGVAYLQQSERRLPETSIHLAEMDRSGSKFDLLALFDADLLVFAS